MALITQHYIEAPVEAVSVYLEEGEKTLPLYESKRLVEEHISKGVPVFLYGTNGYSMKVHRGTYKLAESGDKLAAIIALRAQGYQVYVMGVEIR